MSRTNPAFQGHLGCIYTHTVHPPHQGDSFSVDGHSPFVNGDSTTMLKVPIDAACAHSIAASKRGIPSREFFIEKKVG